MITNLDVNSLNSLGVNMQAQAMLPVVISMLQLLDEDGRLNGVDAQIRPLYNGRERGYVLVLCPERGTLDRQEPACLHIFFAESRASDALFVWSWEARWSLFDRSIKLPKEYAGRPHFPWLRLDKVHDAMLKTVEAWLRRPDRYADAWSDS